MRKSVQTSVLNTELQYRYLVLWPDRLDIYRRRDDGTEDTEGSLLLDVHAFLSDRDRPPSSAEPAVELLFSLRREETGSDTRRYMFACETEEERKRGASSRNT